MIRNQDNIRIVLSIENDANALKTIQTLRSLEGFKGLSFKYKE